jgi:hypothetical protein
VTSFWGGGCCLLWTHTLWTSHASRDVAVKEACLQASRLALASETSSRSQDSGVCMAVMRIGGGETCGPCVCLRAPVIGHGATLAVEPLHADGS